jgi:hypothetical protein
MRRSIARWPPRALSTARNFKTTVLPTSSEPSDTLPSFVTYSSSPRREASEAIRVCTRGLRQCLLILKHLTFGYVSMVNNPQQSEMLFHLEQIDLYSRRIWELAEEKNGSSIRNTLKRIVSSILFFMGISWAAKGSPGGIALCILAHRISK